MHDALADFFARHKDATADHVRSVHDQLMASHDLCDAVDAHVRDLQSQLTRAELAVHDRAIDAKLEWMHTRLKAAADCATAFRRAHRDLARVLVEVDRSFSQDEQDLNAMLAE